MIRTFRLLAPRTLAGKLFLLTSAALLLATLAACGGAKPATPTPTEATAVEAPTPTAIVQVSDIAGTGQTSTPTPLGERPQYGGIINFHTRASSPTLDPWDFRANWTVGYLWYNSLFQVKYPLDPTKGIEIEPGLATQWSQSEDGSKWTLKLRQGVTFHDGEVFNADDVVATTQRALDPKVQINNFQIPMKQIFTGIRKVDDYTVVLDTGEANAAAWTYIIAHHFSIAPEHLISGDPTATEPAKRWRWMHPQKTGNNTGTLGIGTGPFKQIRWDPEVDFAGVRYPNYWKFDEFGNRLPYLDGYVLTTVPDGTRRLARFVAGTEDYTNGLAAGMHPDQARTLCKTTRDPGCYTYQYPHGTFPIITNPNSTEVFKNAKVLTATRYAVDMDAVLNRAYGGRQGFMWMDRGRFPDTALSVKEQHEVFPWSDPARRDEFKQKAKELMNEAGYSTGTDTPFPAFANTCTGSFLDHATRMLEQWFQMGLRIPLECREGLVINDELKASRWSMTVLGANITLLDPGTALLRWALLDSGAVANAPWRYDGQVEVDAKYRKTVRTVDAAVRNERYKDIERYMANPALSMFQSGYTTVFMSVHSCVRNFHAGGVWESHIWSHERTWLAPNSKCRE